VFSKIDNLRDIARAKLSISGFSLEEIEANCEQVIVFGSASVGQLSPESDLDLLCIGHGSRFKNRAVDLIFIHPNSKKSERWLGCELAAHVAKYGIWIYGVDDWSSSAFVSRRSVELKQRIVASRINTIKTYWCDFSDNLKQKHSKKLRRDLQRFSLLDNGIAVAPSPLLDSNWIASRSEEQFMSLLAKAGAEKMMSEDLLQEIILRL